MPANHHISIFAVWQAERRGATPPPVDEEGGEGEVGTGDQQTGETPTSIDPGLLTPIRQEAWRQVGVAFNRDSSFAVYARNHNLGAPLTNEFDTGNIRAQGFTGGIVYAPIGQWNNIDHVTW
jgi:hypothetical protein